MEIASIPTLPALPADPAGTPTDGQTYVNTSSGRLGVAAGGQWRQIAMTPDISVADLAAPYIIAHRGGTLLGPEHALPTYQQALGYTPLIEQDVQLAADGHTLLVHHDTTVDRATPATGTVIDFPPHQWNGLTLEASTLYHRNYPDIPGGCATLDEVFARFGSQRCVFVIEVKGTVTASACAQVLLALVQQWGLESRVIVQGWDITTLQPFIDAGIDTMYLFSATSSGVPSPSSMAGAGVRWAAAGTTVDDATIASYAAEAGLHTVVWTLSKQWEWDHYAALGVDGCFANDPAYLCGIPSRYQRTSSNLGAGLPDVGQTLTDDAGSGAGYLTALADLVITDGYVSSTPAQFMGLTHGYLSPLPTSCTVSMEAWYQQGDGTTTRWVSMFLGVTDQDFTDGATTPQGLDGWHVLFRVNGTVDIYEVVDGAAAGKIATGSSGLWTNGTWQTVRVTVSGTTITGQIGSGATVTATNSAHRPLPYLTTRINTGTATSMEFRQRNLTVT